MDVLAAVRSYVTKAVKLAQGMKVLLLDDETTPIISLALSQSEILKEEVYLFEKINQDKREAMPHLQAICFFRPTEDTLEALKKELRNPKYGTYYLFFTNTVNENYLRQIAYADELEVIKEVHEFYADFYAVNPDTFHLNLTGPGVLDSNQPSWSSHLGRITDGLAACLLSLKIRPVVRAQRTSSLAIQVGQAIKSRIENSSTFHVGTKANAPLLLIMDRCEDPVTPLLTAWTYQAMLHQLLNMKNNRMDLSHVPSIRDELKQVVVSSTQDDFYKAHMYDDFGDLGVAIKDFVDRFQEETNSNSKLESIEDIKRFVEKYPDFRKTSGSVSKHVALMGELQRVTQSRKLLTVSPVEQELACHEDHSAAVEAVRELLNTPGGIDKGDALRVVLLYALRYASNTSNCMEEFVNILLRTYQIPDYHLVVIRLLREWCSPNKRSQGLDLLENQNWLSSMSSKMKRGLVGVSNIFTQHEPLLKKITTLLKEQKLDSQAYPYVVGQPPRNPPTEVIIFVVGGITYEEAAMVNALNKVDGFSYVLGGTGMVRPDEFLSDVLSLKRN